MAWGRTWVAIAATLITIGCGDDGAGSDTTTDATSTDTDVTVAPTMPTTATTVSTTDGTTMTTMPATSSTTGPADTGTTVGSEGSSGSTSGVTPCVGMSFFATSVGSGANGGNLGGLDGADATCQSLAEAVEQGDCTWRAYLSTSTENARDRIGTGPWENSAGDVIAADVDALHDDGLSNGNPQHVLDENGVEVPAQEHDILTGSQEDGTLLADATCSDWTSSAEGDGAHVGHSDIPVNFSPSWNSAHTVDGCSAENLDSTNGAGRLYCFAL